MFIDRQRNTIITKYSAQYLLNDPSHRSSHFRTVEKTALEINDVLELDQDPLHIMLVAYFHDLFAWSRNNHHQLAFEWVRTTDDPFIKQLHDKDRARVAAACLEHRATYDGNFSSKLSELMSAADREAPTSVKEMMKRSIEYHLFKERNQAKAEDKARVHIKDKFGTNGYARYPEIYMQVYGDKLYELQKAIDLL